MKKNIIVLCVLCFSWLLMAQDVTITPVAADNINEADYYISQSFLIDADDFVGRMELLQDIKLKKRKSAEYKFTEDLDIVTMETPQEKIIQYKEAVLILRSKDGKVISSEKLKSAWVSIMIEKMYGDERKTFFVSQDYQKGYGAYSGFGTELYEVHDSKITRLGYRLDNKIEPELNEHIVLYSNLRMEYKIVEAKKGKAVLYVRTKIGGEKVIYTRFEFDGKYWVCYSREAKGFFENDGGEFPETSLFYGKSAVAITPNP